MMRINYEASDYEKIDSVKELVESVGDLFDKFYNNFNNRYEPLQQADRDIEDKKKQIDSYTTTIEDCNKKIEELSRLRDKTKKDIDDLSEKKKEISYTDSEVQKLEEEDIDSEINSKNEKIARIETKLLNAREKLEINKFNKEDAEKELDEAKEYKKKQEAFIKKTEDILDLLTSTKEKFEGDIASILESSSDIDDQEPEIVSETESDYPKIDFDLKEIELDLNDPEEEVEEDIELPNQIQEQPEQKDTLIEVPPIETTDVEDLEEAEAQDTHEIENKVEATSPLKEIFEREGVAYEDFEISERENFERNTERVKEVIEVLKGHGIPLNLTIKQSNIFYKKDAKELDELLNIITTDEEGSGMGFTIDFVYYVLNELASVDIDKLIGVYNSEFMKVDAKTGLIELLKKAMDNSSDFVNNKEANKKVLLDIGVTTVSAIEETYPEFLELDNPLFVNALNLFDKEDLVEKLNDEIKIIPKIIAYWRNN